MKPPYASDRNRFGFFQPRKKNLNLGVHPVPCDVGPVCDHRGMTNARILADRLADLVRREHAAMADFLVALAEFD